MPSFCVCIQNAGDKHVIIECHQLAAKPGSGLGDHNVRRKPVVLKMFSYIVHDNERAAALNKCWTSPKHNVAKTENFQSCFTKSRISEIK